MHSYIIPDSLKERVIQRQGKLLSHDTIDPARSAFVVIDMQNYFVAEGSPPQCRLRVKSCRTSTAWRHRCATPVAS